MRLIATLALAAAAALTSAAQAEDLTVKIGVLTDMSSLYADVGGPGSVVAAKLAVDDFNPAAHGLKVELVNADIRTSPTSAPASRGNGSTSITSTPSSMCRTPPSRSR